MRENMGLYRGKRKVDGKWVEGAFLHLRVGCDFICDGTVWIGTLQPVKYEVDPETVGQFIGLTDKNGKKIFEGDILKITWSYHDRDPVSERCFVEFSKGGFFAKLDGRYKAQVANYACAGGGISVEIIGNIHDNPELLEVSK